MARALAAKRLTEIVGYFARLSFRRFSITAALSGTAGRER
jgi:hypothetical protein